GPSRRVGRGSHGYWPASCRTGSVPGTGPAHASEAVDCAATSAEPERLSPLVRVIVTVTRETTSCAVVCVQRRMPSTRKGTASASGVKLVAPLARRATFEPAAEGSAKASTETKSTPATRSTTAYPRPG